ncbi:hypothetical protein GPECTOR_6g746 [Gonium pectorale]|uniref:Uncharacterized protein n=1 Tax=Gonium pectorale TaxID=33097 RepID=A0A150GVW1_GONPE|nr:hypothetical protein GPECTOR_6g746 [Gonium pectorale]|eukprot:KXZ53828.1 hypothetical protein GPECTOR_6g746 [Gonium pectorale]
MCIVIVRQAGPCRNPNPSPVRGMTLQFKVADVSSVLSVCAVLMSVQQLAAQFGSMLQPTDVVGVRLAAYQLFTDVVSVPGALAWAGGRE